ncbi:NAD(P)/FAD-dependent oxidoreductase [Paenibacillus sanguinis]|uniref:NAD(P)/FAD-dependent oxidoreductase n=1 Tax=Paenibacillus sanguinis TaxID=225906 RepID=UPI000365E6EB|nr:FAD-dependent oxidoreductase [Paenibacillus sanguinis]
MNAETAEVAIIGGGIIGLSIAYYAAKAGMDVVVLERGELAGGTSSKCDGNILAIDKDPGFDSQMSLKSQALVSEWVKELDEEFEYRAPGSILVCETEHEMEAAAIWVSRQREAGLPFRLLDRRDLREESPYLADDLLGGLECATDSTVHPVLLTYSLAATARRHGGRLRTHTPVKALLLEGGKRIKGVDTTSGAIYAKHVVIAAGVWAKQIGSMAGIDIPIEPRKGHILVASRSASLGKRKVMEFGYLLSKFGGERNIEARLEQYGIALVYEPTASQNFLIGSSRQFAGMDTRVDQEVIRLIAERAIRFYPGLEHIPLLRAYAGLRPWTPDHLPIVSAIDEIPGLYVAAGHEGDGISLAAVTGKLMSEMLSGAVETCIPAEPLRYDRFRLAGCCGEAKG